MKQQWKQFYGWRSPQHEELLNGHCVKKVENHCPRCFFPCLESWARVCPPGSWGCRGHGLAVTLFSAMLCLHPAAQGEGQSKSSPPGSLGAEPCRTLGEGLSWRGSVVLLLLQTWGFTWQEWVSWAPDFCPSADATHGPGCDASFLLCQGSSG